MKHIIKIKDKPHKINLNVIVKESLVILVMAVTIAVTINELRQASLPLFGFDSTKIAGIIRTNIPRITLTEAYNLYRQHKVVFVDARDPFSFEEGHIKGAINMYPDEVAFRLAQLKAMLSAESIVVTYCDGLQCPLSQETAQTLQSHGVPVVKVLADGWSLWINAGYPVTKGQI